MKAVLNDERMKAGIKDSRIAELEAAIQESTTQIEQQQATISLLVSEKTALIASVEHLQHTESSMLSIIQPTLCSLTLYQRTHRHHFRMANGTKPG